MSQALHHRLTCLSLAAAACAPAAALERPLWEFGLGATALSLPHYRGSDQTQSWLLPLPYFVYRGQFFRADREGARAVLLDSERFELDFSLAASAPTRSEDNLARQGMPDLAPTIEIGPNANFGLARGTDWKVELRVPVRAAFTLEGRPHHVGWSATPYATLEGRVRGWDVGVRAGPLWGDRRLNAYVYEVAPVYATAQRPAWRARAGFGGWQTTLGASRRFGPWWVGAFVRHDSVAGAAFEGSPLVRQRGTVAAGVALSWVFSASSVMVDAPD